MNPDNRPSALIVDDNEENRVIFRVCLRTAGYKTTEVSSGIEALTLMRTEPTFHLMVLDLQMPEMTGVEVLEQLQSLPSARPMHIIVATANAHMASGEVAQQGADFLVYKPVSISDFTTLVQRLRIRIYAV